MTNHLFSEEPYKKNNEAVVTEVNDRGGIILDQTTFYATSGGQPGDTGTLKREDGTQIKIGTTIFEPGSKKIIIHVPEEEQAAPEQGEKVSAEIDWERRYNLMKMHTACHILSVVCPYPITGASVSETDSRVDFDMEQTADKIEITKKMMEIIEQDYPVFTKWITEEELVSNPGLVKSKNVRPPMNVGKIRLVCIGDDAAIDSQPCGGTHVKSTKELGDMHIGKIEKKGRENRRMRIRFGTMPNN